MKNKFSAFINPVLSVLALLMPVFFLPVTSEFFEFNKLMLLFVGLLVILALWIFQIFKDKNIATYKSIMDAPLFLALIAVVLSTIFSVNKDLSIFGEQGRWFPSLFSAGLFFFYYYAVLSGIREKVDMHKILGFLTFGITLASLVSLLSYFGIYIGTESYLRINSFNLYGSVNYNTVMAAVGVILSFGMLFQKSKLVGKLTTLFAVIVNLFLTLLTYNTPALVILVTGLVLTGLFIDMEKVKNDRIFYSLAGGTVLGLLIITLVPTTRNFIVSSAYLKELQLPLRESWVVASSIIRDDPILGTGPSAFVLDFTKHRPSVLNNGNMWSIKFDKPANELLNILGNLGIVGFVLALFAGSKIVRLAISGLKDQETRTTAILVITASTLFFTTHFSVIYAYVYITLLAMLVATTAKTEGRKLAQLTTINLASLPVITTIGEEGAIRKEYFHYVLVIPFVALMGYSGYVAFRLYAGEFYMRKSFEAAARNDGIKVFEYQAKAIQYNTQRDVYQSAFAQTNLALANSIAAKQDLTDQDKQTIQQLISQAIRNTRITTEVLNPFNVDNWITRANLYRAIAPVAQNSADWAVAAYTNAIQLSPTDPRIRLDLGGLYFAAGDYLSAASYYRQAISLKGDYANAHFNFAQALIKLNDYESAKKSLEVVKALVPADSEDYKIVEQQIAALPATATTEQGKPTVEQLEGTNAVTTPTKQEPLTTVGQEELIKGENLNLDVLPKTEGQN